MPPPREEGASCVGQEGPHAVAEAHLPVLQYFPARGRAEPIRCGTRRWCPCQKPPSRRRHCSTVLIMPHATPLCGTGRAAAPQHAPAQTPGPSHPLPTLAPGSRSPTGARTGSSHPWSPSSRGTAWSWTPTPSGAAGRTRPRRHQGEAKSPGLATTPRHTRQLPTSAVPKAAAATLCARGGAPPPLPRRSRSPQAAATLHRRAQRRPRHCAVARHPAACRPQVWADRR